MDPLDAFFDNLNEEAPNTAKATGVVDEDELLLEKEEIEKTPVEKLESKIEIKQEEQRLPIRKNIYIPSSEISSKSQTDIEDLRKRLGNIVVHGLNVLCPIVNWTDCGLPAPLMSHLRLRGFKQPTSIQCQAIPCILSGRDIIGCAVTGSGKTLAFIIPCLLHVLAQPPTGQYEAAAVILSPTRELAYQTHIECQKIFSLMDKKSACLVGGNDIENQLRAIKNGSNVIIATPGRFIDLLSSSAFNIKKVSYLVIDEADRMFDLGFEPQVIRIAERMRKDRQTLMFSATFPHTVERIARKLLQNSIEIVVGLRNVVTPNINQSILVTNEDNKFNSLLKILGDYTTQGQALVFTNTQDRAEDLFGKLNKSGYSVGLLHGSMDSPDRNSILHDFREGRFSVLVLTSVGARGIDIASIICVINYDAPDHEADYVHRVGRTGRAGKKGYAFTFVTDKDKTAAAGIKNAMKKSGCEIPKDLEDLCQGVKAPGLNGFWRGSGFKFDKEEAKSLLALRKAQNDDPLQQKEEEDQCEEEAKEIIEDKSVLKVNDNLYIGEANINDYTKKARASVSSADNLNSVMDETGTMIIQKGVFCPPGVKPLAGERRLYLRIEGTTKFAVQAALNRIEEMANAADPIKSKLKTKFQL
ncbi:DEAD/DEAH box helicase family protein [Trichomonas vaginalis G3]|uniref:DEAD/DEAH box helicase family protein n=1 Tax=Trichomonas vaginalis (strain ATCC PRA-98 / G3) TaxID=412133 RepID=A2DES1_TRIV3|nr:RNA helicase family [Trichomonas vaginalis G3]EAY21198.1 DEAD/DEAH box helicase family protein [Trichomonas vaginalis G3]KAI5522272.1 RNA helicase family [Trichomonas vaginalis G3]|eukprot:XP_001582184.1 DEAD/DEAH box helicase family protein [Trichomonas vaginalis G3]